MTIKIAKVYIIRNSEEESFFRKFARKILNYEVGATKYDTIVIVLDDNTIHEIQNLNKNSMLVEFSKSTVVEVDYKNENPFDGIMPAYIKLNTTPVITMNFSVPTYVPEKGYISKKPMNVTKSLPSKYNLAYELDNKEEAFTLTKIKSSDESLEFVASYNCDIIDNTTLLCLIYKLLMQ